VGSNSGHDCFIWKDIKNGCLVISAIHFMGQFRGLLKLLYLDVAGLIGLDIGEVIVL
jgi:hypothetical protein